MAAMRHTAGDAILAGAAMDSEGPSGEAGGGVARAGAGLTHPASAHPCGIRSAMIGGDGDDDEDD